MKDLISQRHCLNQDHNQGFKLKLLLLLRRDLMQNFGQMCWHKK